jgi:hypothetical protein
MWWCLELPSPVSSATACGWHGSFSDAGDVFICNECQADAKKLIEIQDSISAEIAEASESSDGTVKRSNS